MLIVSASIFASPGSVVFNSFKDRSLALKESAQISRQFGIEARIEEARVNGLTYHRVLGPVMDQASARELIRQARANGLGDVWVLSSKERPVVRMQRRVQEPKTPISKSVVEPIWLFGALLGIWRGRSWSKCNSFLRPWAPVWYC